MSSAPSENPGLRVTSAWWQQKTFLVFVPHLNNKNSPSSTARVPLWEPWSPAPCAKKYGQESGLTTLADRQTDIAPSCGLCSDSWPTSCPSSVVQELLENTVLDNHQWTRGILWKSRLPEKSQHIVGAKQYLSGYKERVKGIVLLYLNSSSPRLTHLRAQRDFLGRWFVPQGKGRACETTSSFPRMVAKELISLWPLLDYWIPSYMTGGWKKAGRGMHRTLGGHKRTWILLIAS